MSTEFAASYQNQKKSASVFPCADRVYRSAASLVASGEKTNGLNAGALGALMILLKLASSAGADSGSGRPELTATQARLALSMRGIPAVEMDLIFGALQVSGHVTIEAERICVNAVATAFEFESNLLARRKAGWKKRLEPSVGGLVPINFAPKLDKVPTKQKKADVKNAEVAALADRRSLTRRFASSDAIKPDLESDPVVVRLSCEGGRVAEVTQDYVSHLQGIFGDVEILVQLKLMANWLESNPAKRKTFAGIRRFINAWLRNASSTVSMRREIIKNSAATNGFGSGGAYSQDCASKNVLSGDFDDLTDLLEEKNKGVPQAQPAAGSPMVAAARNRATFLRQTRLSQSIRDLAA